VTPRILAVSVTERGRRIAASLPYPRFHGALGDTVRAEWHRTEAFVLVVAIGAAVRVVAPLLSDKHADPVIVCVDDTAQFVVPVVGGHRGGDAGPSGNDLAREVAGLLGATPVITTATDATGFPPLDQLGEFGVEGDTAAVTAALLDGSTVRLENRLGWPLPLSLAQRLDAGSGRAAYPGRPFGPGGTGGTGGPHAYAGSGDTPAPSSGGDAHLAAGAAASSAPATGAGQPTARSVPLLVVTDQIAPRVPRTAVLRPRSLVAGIGASRGAPPGEVAEALTAALAAAGLARSSLHAVATIDRRASDEGIVALGLPISSYPAGRLATVPVPNPSVVVDDAVGTPSVAEAAALLAAGPGATLVAEKRATSHTTVAIARRRRPEGHLAVVGLGQGGPSGRTFDAVRAVRAAEIVIGFSSYIEQCADLISPAQTAIASPIGDEVGRARLALELSRDGRSVVVVCSGDPGVYAMASLVLELADAGAAGPLSSDGLALPSEVSKGVEVEVEVVPGVTAALAAAAALGAPLGHDHLVLSLSDLLTPWELIIARAAAARDADLVVVLYNPRSEKRHWQLGAIRDLFLERRQPATPVGVVTDVGRPGARVSLTTLALLDPDLVGMTTCVIIGSSTTEVLGGKMVTPRGYRR
jgi:cobalt-precorrin 5A hydrolase/precorrin-3B C17-methyltransferase